MLQRHEFSSGLVLHDARYSPVLISTWIGRSDLDAARWHASIERAAVTAAVRSGTRVVSISDATRAERPAPEVRKFWAEHVDSNPAELSDANLATFVVVASPLMRGVMTAIGWMSERARAIESFPSLAVAVEAALERLDEHGIPRPAELSTEYRAPL